MSGQRQQFLQDWQDDKPLFQVGRGEKRSFDEVNDGAGTSTAEEVGENDYYTVTEVKQVKVKNIQNPFRVRTTQFNLQIRLSIWNFLSIIIAFCIASRPKQ